MLDVRNYERTTYLKKVKKQYGAPAAGDASGPPI